MTIFPDHGRPRPDVEARLDAASVDHHALRAGPASFSLEVDEDLQGVIRHAFARFMTHNPVFGDALPSLAEIERDVVAMAVEITNAGPEGTAFVTLGGSESIFTAMHGARARARARGLEEPFQVVAPSTIHPAFAKACHYLGMELVAVPPGADLRADVAAMAAAVSARTVAICGSAPQWPHHRFDDITAIAAIAVEHDLWMHVDACVGGYLAPFVREAGWPVPPYDFTVPGVCSMSADLHKWGYAAKPASTVLFRDADLAAYAAAPPVEWDCGVYVTRSAAGSRPGASLAAAWAVLQYLGRDGFVDLARRTMQVRDRLAAGIDAIDGMASWPTDLAMVIYGSETLDTMAIGDAMEARGWLVMRLVRPWPQLQLLVDRLSDDFVEAFLADLADSVEQVRAGERSATAGSRGAY